MESLFLQRQYCRVTIFPNNIIDPKAACTSENCECGCRLLWSVEPFKKQPALTVFQVQAAFGKIRTLVAPSPQPSTIAAQHIHLTTIGILQYLSPGLQFLLGLTAFHEPFSRMQFAGYLWVWTGVALFVWGARNTKTT